MQAYFVDRCDMTRIKMKFIYASTGDLSAGVDFFEQGKVQVHCSKSKMESLLITQLGRCVKEELLTNLDEETNVVSKKTSHELLNIEVKDRNMLENQDIFIGTEVEKEIKALGLHPSSPKIQWLFDMARKFHKTVCKFLIKYFATGLKSSIMDNMSGLSPYYQSHIITSRKIKALASHFSKVVDNIEFVGCMDKLKTEVEQYVLDKDIEDLKDMYFEDYWMKVGEITDGEASWVRYLVLPRFALAMGVKHNDTSTVERTFSIMNYVHQNKQRNSMKQDMLDSHLHIRSGVESKENKNLCKKCTEPVPVEHCHCSVAEVTEEMREECRKAWLKCTTAQTGAAEEAKGVSHEMEEKLEKSEAAEKERVQKVSEDLKTKENFYSSSKMKGVYMEEKESGSVHQGSSGTQGGSKKVKMQNKSAIVINKRRSSIEHSSSKAKKAKK